MILTARASKKPGECSGELIEISIAGRNNAELSVQWHSFGESFTSGDAEDYLRLEKKRPKMTSRIMEEFLEHAVTWYADYIVLLELAMVSSHHEFFATGRSSMTSGRRSGMSSVSLPSVSVLVRSTPRKTKHSY
ncbi:hypothetical protein KQX54_019851 [Cotesia glomerata]|uniref:Uncharacterized protein n=1 Tax=Cotesia glomerata TaxID=32391 RepID=A0AAV7HXL5_COTGL|nr:hypothetical protein KQX54_019851 [Cotesia glomerata]